MRRSSQAAMRDYLAVTEKRQTYTAGPEHAGSRLDQFLVAAITDVSRSRVQHLIEQGRVLVNGKAARASHRMDDGEVVEVIGSPQPAPLKAIPEDIPLDVVYEDDSLAVINKPAGMMVHAGAGAAGEDEEDDPRTKGTLVNALLYRFNKLSQEGGPLRPGIVHRLDKETSGLMIVAKTDAAHRKLAEQFAGRAVQKKYLALVHGWLKSPRGTINAPIGRDTVRRSRMSTRSREGRDAVSHYEVVRTFDTLFGKFTLLEVMIETGRTHQIRVHLASIGHPVVGDHLYGAPRQIEPLPGVSRRATPKHTKALRDREATDRARHLTEAKMGTALKNTGRGGSREQLDRSAPDRIILDRNFLHAAEIAFIHPKSQKAMHFREELPSELASFLEQLTHLTR
jgi:23S rRNA pseudouridine1911/1915/1917 synthase